MADLITISRIFLSILLLFLPFPSLPFLVLYIAGGVTDMADGFVARATGTAGPEERSWIVLQMESSSSSLSSSILPISSSVRPHSKRKTKQKSQNNKTSFANSGKAHFI